MNNDEDILVPKITKPLRVIFLFESTRGWYETSKQKKDTEILPKLNEVFKEWEKSGSKMIGTLDADVFSAGQANYLGWHACFLYDVPDFEIVALMTHAIREKELDCYFRIEAIIGRKFFMLER